MATESIENVIIFRADTGEAVRTVGDLRDNIKAYKDALDQVEIGTKEYDNILKALQINQAALKDAMHATTSEENQQAASMESIAKAAMGAGNSYNALVKRMAELDQEFRRTEDIAKRDQLGAQIKNINAQLKEMDEQRGKFGRNVGNYKSALDGLSGTLGSLGGGARALVQPIKNVDMGFKALSANPVIGVLGLMATALAKVISGLKTSEENTMAWDRALAAFKPIADSFTRSMQAVGKAIADTANWIVDLLEKWGLLNEASQQRIALEEKNQEIIRRQRAIALENASLENEIAQLRDKAAQKDKYTAKERLKFLEDAVKWESRIAKNNMTLAQERLAAAEKEAALTGNSTETLERLNQLKIAAMQAETNYYTTTRRLQAQMVTARAEIASEGAAGFKAIQDSAEAAKAALEALENEIIRETDPSEFMAPDFSVTEDWDAFFGQLIQKQDEYNANAERLRQEDQSAQEAALAWQKQHTYAKLEIFTNYASGVANLASAIASVYEADAEASEEAAAKSKAIQTAAAIVQTIGGAVSAFMSTWKAPELGLIAKSILAPINAASVLAAGYAQVKQINAVKVGRSSGGTISTPAVVSAPSSAVSGMTPVQTITGASEEERLNQMASKSKVYLVVSELEAKQSDMKVQLAESTF